MLTPPLLEIRGVSKDYGGLRPLRIEALSVAEGETVVVEGPDQAGAAVFVDLVTGTTLPDAGEVTVAGTATRAIPDHDAWLKFLEQFGIVSPRVVLLDELTVLQNLAVPLTLDLEPLAPDARRRAQPLAAEVRLGTAVSEGRLADAAPLTRFRVKLGRAICHDPRLLLVEHPTLGLDAADARECASTLRSVVTRRHLASVVITGDPTFAGMIAGRRLVWQAPTGRVTERGGRRGWFKQG